MKAMKEEMKQIRSENAQLRKQLHQNNQKEGQRNAPNPPQRNANANNAKQASTDQPNNRESLNKQTTLTPMQTFWEYHNDDNSFSRTNNGRHK